MKTGYMIFNRTLFNSVFRAKYKASQKKTQIQVNGTGGIFFFIVKLSSTKQIDDLCI